MPAAADALARAGAEDAGVEPVRGSAMLDAPIATATMPTAEAPATAIAAFQRLRGPAGVFAGGARGVLPSRRNVRATEGSASGASGNSASASAARSSLLPLLPAIVLDDEVVERASQVRAEARLRGIVAGEVTFLEGAREEGLRQIARLLDAALPAQANVRVDRLPVGADERFERRSDLRGIGAAERRDRRLPGRRKAMSGGVEIVRHL